MDKILELTINTLIKRIESLEREVADLKKEKSNSNYNPHKPVQASKTEEASSKQIKFLKDLGVELTEKITKYEAKMLIQETLNNQQKPIIKSESNEKPLKEETDKTTSTTQDTKKEVPVEKEGSSEDNFDEEGTYL